MAKIVTNIPSTGLNSTHNQLAGLNEGDYLHLTQTEKDNLFTGEGLVPYTGAEEDVDLGEFQLKSNGAIFTDSVVVPEGMVDNEAVNFGQLKIDTGASPSVTTVTVGGIPAGTNIQNKTFETLLTDILIAYLYPKFIQFLMIIDPIIEVGVVLSGSKQFNWSIENNGNVNENSVLIKDATSNTILGSGLVNNNNTAILNIGTIINTSPIINTWMVQATNTKNETFFQNFILQSIYPIFYGVSNSKPTANQALINGGTKAIVQSSGTLNITFGASGQYLWFAHPAINPTKTKWYVNALNNGNIGSISDLFNAPTTVSITTVMWAGVSYKVYISNIPTTTSGNMELKNS